MAFIINGKIVKLAGRIATREAIEKLTAGHPLPDADSAQSWNRIRYVWFSAYRRLFALTFVANLVSVVVLAAMAGSFSYQDAIIAVAVNLLVNSIIRNEHAINTIFHVCTSIPHRTPLGIRRLAAKVYSYGGIHSGCGVCASMWYIFFAILLVNQFNGAVWEAQALAVITATSLFALVVLLTLAHPWMRAHFHDQWEMSHRYSAWSLIVLIWSQTMIIAHASARDEDTNMGHLLVTSASFWCLIGVTLILGYSWVRVRTVKFTVEKLSDHATRLWFLEDRRVTACAAIKLSTSPLTENHGFATIPNPKGVPGYSGIISNAGNWTSMLINNPPSKLYIRGYPTIGALRVAKLFERVVLVATGSGIGPLMSFMAVHSDWPVHIVWSARAPEKTYGADVIRTILRVDPRAIIVDSQKTPVQGMNLVRVVHAVYKSSGSEAVVIIANKPATEQVVYELEVRKVPAFGAIFDS